MTYDPNLHHRRSIRLSKYDYSQSGAYFITVCAQDHICRFGRIIDGVMHLNQAGLMIDQQWHALAQRFPTIQLDAHIVMPNHFHGIIMLTDPTHDVECNQTVGVPLVGTPSQYPGGHGVEGRHEACSYDNDGRKSMPNPKTLGNVVGAFKSITIRLYIQGVRSDGWSPFRGRLWRRNYWERIIRDERELQYVRQYIEHNPLRWHFDKLNPRGAK